MPRLVVDWTDGTDAGIAPLAAGNMLRSMTGLTGPQATTIVLASALKEFAAHVFDVHNAQFARVQGGKGGEDFDVRFLYLGGRVAFVFAHVLKLESSKIIGSAFLTWASTVHFLFGIAPAALNSAVEELGVLALEARLQNGSGGDESQVKRPSRIVAKIKETTSTFAKTLAQSMRGISPEKKETAQKGLERLFIRLASDLAGSMAFQVALLAKGGSQGPVLVAYQLLRLVGDCSKAAPQIVTLLYAAKQRIDSASEAALIEYDLYNSVGLVSSFDPVPNKYWPGQPQEKVPIEEVD